MLCLAIRWVASVASQLLCAIAHAKRPPSGGVMTGVFRSVFDQVSHVGRISLARLYGATQGHRRSLAVFVVHPFLIGLATYLAIWLRFDGDVPSHVLANYWRILPWTLGHSWPHVCAVRLVSGSLEVHEHFRPDATRAGRVHEQPAGIFPGVSAARPGRSPAIDRHHRVDPADFVRGRRATLAPRWFASSPVRRRHGAC